MPARCNHRPSTVVKAVAAGHGAANAINKDLGVDIHRDHDSSIEPPFLKFDVEGIKQDEATKLPGRPVEERTLELEDYAGRIGNR